LGTEFNQKEVIALQTKLKMAHDFEKPTLNPPLADQLN